MQLQMPRAKRLFWLFTDIETGQKKEKMWTASGMLFNPQISQVPTIHYSKLK